MSISPVSIATPNLAATFASTRLSSDVEQTSPGSIAPQLDIAPPATSVEPETARPVQEVTPSERQELATTTQDVLRLRAQVTSAESTSPGSEEPATSASGNPLRSSLSAEIAQSAEAAIATAESAAQESAEDPPQTRMVQQAQVQDTPSGNPYLESVPGEVMPFPSAASSTSRGQASA